MRTAAIFLLVLMVVSAPAGPGAAQESTPEPSTEETDERLEEFVPSERVPADSAISFPVDI